MSDTSRISVIVGVGEVNDRPVDPEGSLDPVGLMAAAAREADADGGGGWLALCDWVAITPQIAFRGLDVVTLLPKALGLTSRRVLQASSPDGDTPVRHLNDAANAIGAGEAHTCLVVGGEALRTAARRAADSGGLFKGSQTSASDLRRRYGLITPSDIYPLYENACRAAWGQTLAEAQAETGLIWSQMSQVAAHALGAWLKTPRTAEEIVRPGPDNRPIAFPYTKLTVANASVNQGAALIVTSLERAREAGVPEAQIVYIGAGAAAHEAHDPLSRARFDGSPAMQTALESALEANGLTPPELTHVELYSCFPCVPKMARRELDLPASRPLTVHGGLTFGGGPIGNYMAHAASAMVRELRSGGGRGLLYGQGGHCTHNHALVLSAAPIPGVRIPQDYNRQALADARRAPIPLLDDAYEGEAVLETYTVVYGRDGEPAYGVVLARRPGGDRVLARVEATDFREIAFLTDGRCEPVGAPGRTRRLEDRLHWTSEPTRSRP